jgi:hypothetical protein
MARTQEKTLKHNLSEIKVKCQFVRSGVLPINLEPPSLETRHRPPIIQTQVSRARRTASNNIV